MLVFEFDKFSNNKVQSGTAIGMFLRLNNLGVVKETPDVYMMSDKELCDYILESNPESKLKYKTDHMCINVSTDNSFFFEPNGQFKTLEV